MIEVTLQLMDAMEVQLLAQLQGVIEQKRAQQFEQSQSPVGAPAPDPENGENSREGAEDDNYVEATYDAELTTPAESGAVDLAPSIVSQTSVPDRVPSDIEVARAITTYSQKHGMPAAKELLASFDVKKTSQLPDEKKLAFVTQANA